MDYYKESLKMHEEHRGKMEVASKVKVTNKDDLSTAYTPGVAEPCRKIHENPEDVYKYTNKSNTVAVISDGSAVLGLGNIGGLASIPVMDGKSLLFKEFAGIDAFPVCLETQDVDEIVNIAKNIAPTLGGINLEDIACLLYTSNTNFRGLYQAINNEFCRNMPDSTEFVNREEDMGIPNLRKAKLSYKPVKMIEKYIAAFK